jgi:hypothetical protein
MRKSSKIYGSTDLPWNGKLEELNNMLPKGEYLSVNLLMKSIRWIVRNVVANEQLWASSAWGNGVAAMRACLAADILA